MQDSDGTTICRLNSATQEGLARQIAQLVRDMRQVGFEEGRSYVREALGISRSASERGGPGL